MEKKYSFKNLNCIIKRSENIIGGAGTTANCSCCQIPPVIRLHFQLLIDFAKLKLFGWKFLSPGVCLRDNLSKNLQPNGLDLSKNKSIGANGGGRKETVPRSQNIIERKAGIADNCKWFLYGSALNRELSSDCHQLAQATAHCGMAQDIPLLVTHLDVSRLLQDIISVYAICS